MFGAPAVPFVGAPDSGNTGNQVRGFGFTGDGGVDTVFRFLSATVFNPTANSGFPQTNPDATRRDVEQFLLAFDTNLAPIVGQQVTLTSTSGAVTGPRIDLLIARASVKECDLVARVVQNGRVMGYLYDPLAKNFLPDTGAARVSDSGLRNLAATAGQEITYTAMTPGSGPRLFPAE
jgi:hypothetical protein